MTELLSLIDNFLELIKRKNGSFEIDTTERQYPGDLDSYFKACKNLKEAIAYIEKKYMNYGTEDTDV